MSDVRRGRLACRARLADIEVGEGLPVVVMGALNVSPESFYSGSVHVEGDALLRAAEAMVEAGAAVIDVGAMSTAPYLHGAVDEDEERRRLAPAVELLARKLSVPISADTSRLLPARVAVDAGARVLNDVTGLADPRVAELAAQSDVSLVLMASPMAANILRVRDVPADTGDALGVDGCQDEARVPDACDSDPRGETRRRDSADPVAVVRHVLEVVLARARVAGIPDERVVLDPGIGFFLCDATARAEWDTRVLAGLAELAELGRPLAVAVSRKSFIGAVTGRTAPADRLAGSLAATAIAVVNGASLVRTHDVAETVDAVRVAERVRGSAKPQGVRRPRQA